ncbi:MAG TPA: 3-phosphoshikimate 1-carboxyvinyltransferase [Blastocatellia bacterium]|nr:3-phosphoshikimate 1-carboxyvinyltransferase [Blastocatellia bacterium]
MSRTIGIHGKGALRGEVRLPGDKSISHRVAMLAAVAQGTSRIRNFASSADCHATLECMQRLGVRVEMNGGEILIHGQGLHGLAPPESPARLDAQNSGSTIRMLSGILAGQRFTSVIDGDASLRRRPMRRIIEPLALMGAAVSARDDHFAPLTITGGRLRAIDFTSRVASAQVKTCVLFAGLYADGRTTFREPSLSRSHSELMLKEFGARLSQDDDGTLSIEGGVELQAVNYQVPGDLSSAAFFIAGAGAMAGSQVMMRDVSLNATRTGFLAVLKYLGADVELSNVRSEHSEHIGDLRLTGSQLKTEPDGLLLDGEIIPHIIDEIPILAVMATQVEGRVEVRGARELRIKESDRIKTVVAGIRAMGGEIEEYEDGFAVRGPQPLRGARIESEGDHRIAMAFAIAGLMAAGTTEIVDADCASVSFPEFYDNLAAVAGEGQVFEVILK